MATRYALMKRKNGTTMDQFIEHYENHHVPLWETSLPRLRKHVRHYIRPFPTAGDTQFDTTDELPYDVIAEVQFSDQDDADRAVARLRDPEAERLIAEDAARFLETSATRFAAVEDRVTDLRSAGVSDPGTEIRQFGFMKRKQGTTMQHLIEYYESRHAPLSAELVPNLGKYVRHYLRPLESGDELVYDVIAEIRFESRAEFERGMAYLLKPEAVARLTEDETNFLAPSPHHLGLFEDRESALGS